MFYADIFWLESVLMNGITLLLVTWIEKQMSRKKALRILLSSMVGSSIQLMWILNMNSYVAYLIGCHILICPIMIWIAFGRMERKVWVRRMILCYVMVILIYGITEAIVNMLHIKKTSFLTMLMIAMLLYIVLRYLLQSAWYYRHMAKVLLQHQGKECQVLGLIDTGNLLLDPIYHRPVHIVTGEILTKLGVKETQEPMRVTYHTLGKEGVISVYQIQTIIVQFEKRRCVYTPGMLGEAEETLMKEKEYQMIVNLGAERT